MNHPFKVNDRVLDMSRNVAATVTELTDKGFKYKLDKPFNYGARIGYTTEGEVFSEGYQGWKMLPENWVSGPPPEAACQCMRQHDDEKISLTELFMTPKTDPTLKELIDNVSNSRPMTQEERVFTDEFFWSHFDKPDYP